MEEREMITYQGYTGVFDFDPELMVFAGHVIDMRDEIYFEGDSVKALEESMARSVDHYLAVCEERGEEPGKPFSGQLRLRMESELHQQAAVAAAVAGSSLNAWIVGAIVERVADR